MTKMATTSIYGTNWGFGLMIVCSNDNYGLTLTCFKKMSNCVTYAFLYETVKTIDFSETIAACDLKDERCIQLIE